MRSFAFVKLCLFLSRNYRVGQKNGKFASVSCQMPADFKNLFILRLISKFLISKYLIKSNIIESHC